MIPDGIEIRPARPEDEDRALVLIYDPPGPEARGLVGRDDWAVAFGEGLKELGEYRQEGDEMLVALAGDRPVGVLLASRAGSRSMRWRRVPALLLLALRTIPLLELPGFLRRGLLRMRIDLPVPPDSLHVSELHVHPDWRGCGIGAALLDHIERSARERGIRELSLTTLSTNPARRLYGRKGFRVTAASDVSGYEEWTGATGRVLMEKTLAQEADPRIGSAPPRKLSPRRRTRS